MSTRPVPYSCLSRGCCLATLAVLAFVLAGCERETRPFHDLPKISQRAQGESQTPLFAGSPSPAAVGTSPFQGNAWGQGEGKRLYTSYNCAGCHANGGGGIGPPLMDDEWIYGFLPGNIFSSIVQGRPNGMPSFRNKIPDYQVWQIVAYVQSMSGQTPIDTSPGRSDHMQAHTPEIIQPYQGRKQTGHK
jgi:cytochrome c oxidase cbb3-type subunit III